MPIWVGITYDENWTYELVCRQAEQTKIVHLIRSNAVPEENLRKSEGCPLHWHRSYILQNFMWLYGAFALLNIVRWMLCTTTNHSHYMLKENLFESVPDDMRLQINATTPFKTFLDVKYFFLG